MPKHPDDLRQHERLSFSMGSASAVWRLQRDGALNPVTLQPRYRASNIFAVRDAAAAGLGVALLPRMIGEPMVQQGQLRVVLPGWATPETPISALFASARYLSPKVRSFIEMAQASFHGNEARQPGGESG